MVAILVVSVCSIRVIRTYTRSIQVCLCGDDAGGGRGAPPDVPICGMGKLESFSAYCTRWFPMNTKLSRRPCPARASRVHSFTRARAHRSPSRAASRARPTPDLEPGDARARFASTRRDARVDRPNLAKTSKSRETTQTAYPSITNGRRSIRCARASRDSSDARRRVATTRDGGNHRDEVGGAASRRRAGRERCTTRDGRRRARRRELEASSGRERTKRRRRGGVEGR